MRLVRLVDEAAIEAVEAAAWYEQQRSGLGTEFERALEAALDLLEE